MKKILFLTGTLFLFTGCVNTQQNIKPISMKSVNLLDKYGVSEKALMPVNDGYIFVIPAAGGADVYKLDKNYNLIWKKSTPILIDPVKSEIKNNRTTLKPGIQDIAKSHDLKLKHITTTGTSLSISFVPDKLDKTKQLLEDISRLSGLALDTFELENESGQKLVTATYQTKMNQSSKAE